MPKKRHKYPHKKPLTNTCDKYFEEVDKLVNVTYDDARVLSVNVKELEFELSELDRLIG